MIHAWIANVIVSDWKIDHWMSYQLVKLIEHNEECVCYHWKKAENEINTEKEAVWEKRVKKREK